MRRILIMAAMCTLVAVPAMAGITVTETNVGPGQGVTVVAPGLPSGAGSVSTTAGVYVLTVAGVANVQSFCIDLHQYSGTFSDYSKSTLDLAPTPDTALTPMGTTKAGEVAWLLDAHWQSGMTNQTAAALQSAVWEVINETLLSYDVKTGNTRVTGQQTTENLANLWLTQMSASGTAWGTYSTANYVALVSELGQDYVIKTPVPAAVLLGAIGFVAMGRKLRRLAS